MLPVILVLLIELAIFCVLLALTYYFLSMTISDFFGVPFVPTTNRSIQNIFSSVKIKKTDVFYDLGCGDGRLAFYVAQKYKCIAYGIERNPLLNWFSRFKKRILNIKNVHFFRDNIYKIDLRKATIIYLFLFPEVIERLKPKFIKECKRGTLIISHGFKIKGWDKKIFNHIESKSFWTYFYRV